MGALLDSGMVGNIGLKHLKVIKEDTLNKWNGLGFLDGLKGHVKENIAQLYENQATHLINEATTASDSGSFETVVFPIIRRVFSKLLANDIVSVQAMNLPIGKLFYFVPKIAAYSAVAGQHFQPYGAPGGTPGTRTRYAAGRGGRAPREQEVVSRVDSRVVWPALPAGGGGRPARRGRRHLAPALLAVEIMAAGGRLAPVATRIP